MNSYIEASRNGKVDDYLQRFVRGVDSFESYLAEVGDESKRRIRVGA